MEVDEGSDQISDVQPQWIAAHARLKIEFTAGDKYQNLMSRHKCFFSAINSTKKSLWKLFYQNH